MGYPAFYLMAGLHQAQRQFVVRIYAGFCKEVDAFLAKGQPEGLIEIDVFAEGRVVNPKFRQYLPELEDFTGLSALSVAQDFHTTVLACNINALIINDIDQDLEAENALRSDRKHAYKANRNLSIAKLKDNVIRMLLGEVEVASFYERLKREIKRHKVPIRPGRSYPRKRRHQSKYSMNKKRAL